MKIEYRVKGYSFDIRRKGLGRFRAYTPDGMLVHSAKTLKEVRLYLNDYVGMSY